MDLLFFCLLISIVASCHPKTAKAITNTFNKEASSSIVIDSFPIDWFGDWSGPLYIHDSLGRKDPIPMSLKISETDSSGVYNWVIGYGKDSTLQERPYLLKSINAAAGHFLIDERNGILIDAFYLNNELTSIFEVMGNTLVIGYSKKDQEMVFSVKVYTYKSIRSSGDGIYNGQEIPEVNSFYLKSVQEAVLNKKCLVE